MAGKLNVPCRSTFYPVFHFQIDVLWYIRSSGFSTGSDVNGCRCFLLSGPDCSCLPRPHRTLGLRQGARSGPVCRLRRPALSPPHTVQSPNPVPLRARVRIAQSRWIASKTLVPPSPMPIDLRRNPISRRSATRTPRDQLLVSLDLQADARRAMKLPAQLLTKERSGSRTHSFASPDAASPLAHTARHDQRHRRPHRVLRKGKRNRP